MRRDGQRGRNGIKFITYPIEILTLLLSSLKVLVMSPFVIEMESPEEATDE